MTLNEFKFYARQLYDAKAKVADFSCEAVVRFDDEESIKLGVRYAQKIQEDLEKLILLLTEDFVRDPAVNAEEILRNAEEIVNRTFNDSDGD